MRMTSPALPGEMAHLSLGDLVSLWMNQALAHATNGLFIPFQPRHLAYRPLGPM